MALIACRECGNQVSQLAQACPKCGAPLQTRATGARWPKFLELAGVLFMIAGAIAWTVSPALAVLALAGGVLAFAAGRVARWLKS